MSKELGWEASEEAQEEENAAKVAAFEDAEVAFDGVIFSEEPGEDGTEIRGPDGERGTWITTPKGHKVVVGVAPEDLTPEIVAKLGEVADTIREEMEGQVRQQVENDPEFQERIEWFNSVVASVKDFLSGTDRETIWKVVTILRDYELAARAAWAKGYLEPQWTLEQLVDLLPPCEKVE